MTYYTPTKTKTVTFLAVFAIVFIALMAIGTFFDFEISTALTKSTLPKGEYFSQSAFAQAGEIFGSSPIWLAFCFAFALLVCDLAKTENKKWLKIIVCGVFACLALVGVFMLIKDIFGYLLQQNAREELWQKASVKCTAWFLAFLIWGLVMLICKECKPNPKIRGFIMVILCSCALYILISVIKTPVGRVRFRTINVLYDQTLYTPWYTVNGSRTFEGLAKDCCKSFPSGHTFSAGMIFLLLCLPDIFEFAQKKCVRVFLWIFCIGYTCLVGLSRIVAGAHYLTDITFSGALALAGVMFFREVFITDFACLKVLKSKIKESDV